MRRDHVKSFSSYTIYLFRIEGILTRIAGANMGVNLNPLTNYLNLQIIPTGNLFMRVKIPIKKNPIILCNIGMKKITLITSDNDLYRERFVSAGYTINNIIKPEDVLSRPDDKIYAEEDVIIHEINDADPGISEKIINKILPGNPLIICYSNRINDVSKRILIKCGIADCIIDDTGRLIDYIKILNQKKFDPDKTILIIDDNKPYNRITESIISRFNYRTIIIKAIDDIFDEIKQNNIQLCLINLGTAGFDVTAFVKKSYSNPDIKKIPVIAYKNMREGLFINEIISGINRLTKVILSPEELFGFLVNILFRREISIQITDLNKFLESKDLIRSSGMTLGQIYYSMGIDNFFVDYIFNDEKYRDCCHDGYYSVIRNSNEWDLDNFIYCRRKPNEG